jgi:hypothetical protein
MTTTTTTRASCEARPTTTTTTTKTTTKTTTGSRHDDAAVVNPFLAPGPLRETVLRKRMTAVGRFSLKSETDDKRSIPVFFLALSGTKTKASTEEEGGDANNRFVSPIRPTTDSTFTASDLEDAWVRRGMPGRHPRFHSVVCPERVHFEETHRIHPPSLKASREGDRNGGDDGATLRIKADLDKHATETSHPAVHREDLRYRIERMLTSTLDVSDILWEAKVSSGPLGSSGAISRAKAGGILLPPPRGGGYDDGTTTTAKTTTGAPSSPPSSPSPLRRRLTSGGLWADASRDAGGGAGPSESVLLFRCHHALADGASIMAALSDLSDEAEEIRGGVEAELERWRKRMGGGGRRGVGFLRRILSRLMRLLKLCVWFAFGTTRALAYQTYLQMTTRTNPFDPVLEDARRRGPVPSGRSISWCDAAPLDEVKCVARSIWKATRGGGGVATTSSITVNDIFVSCVTYAVARQLVEHEEYHAAHAVAVADDDDDDDDARGGGRRRKKNEKYYAVPTINVVVPVHLGGGAILPGESVGNNIGAFVAKCPGAIEERLDAKEGAAAGRGGGGGGPTKTTTVERLVRVHESLSRSKGGPAPLVSHHLARFCSDHLPDGVTQSIFRRANANAAVVVSNVRAYDKKLHISGMTLESAAGFLPLPPGIPIGVVVQSYAGVVSLTVNAERWAVPDADKFLGWVLDEYGRLYEEASKLDNKK